MCLLFAEDERESLYDVHFLVCPVRPQDNPKTVTLVSSQCSFSHNFFNVSAMHSEDVVVPRKDIGICTRPLVNSAASVSQITQWIEYLKYQGADALHIYVTNVNHQLDQLLHRYADDVFPFVTATNWTAVSSVVEAVVSAEAAINHCVYDNIMKYRYILVISPFDFPVFNEYPSDLKQLVRDGSFKDAMHAYGGYRLSGGTEQGSPAMVLESEMFLAAAANHFMALTKRPYFRRLDERTVWIGNLTHVKRRNGKLLEELQTMVDRRLNE